MRENTNDIINNPIRNLEINHFNLSLDIFAKPKIVISPLKNPILFYKKLEYKIKGKRFYNHYFINHITESRINTNDKNIIKSLAKLGDRVFFNDCFQNLVYFNHIDNILREEFRLIKPLSKRNLVLKEEISKTKDSIFLHIRRGDYLYSLNNKYVALGCGYYNGALKIFKERLKHPHIFVFSNDMEFAKKHLLDSLDSSIIKNMEFSFVMGNDEANAIEEMELMRACKHAITANSTFSWWAAHLIDNVSKIVTIPSSFFYDDTNPKVDYILPKGWRKIDYVWGHEIK